VFSVCSLPHNITKLSQQSLTVTYNAAWQHNTPNSTTHLLCVSRLYPHHQHSLPPPPCLHPHLSTRY
jgi:hypothetical protein